MAWAAYMLSARGSHALVIRMGHRPFGKPAFLAQVVSDANQVDQQCRGAACRARLPALRRIAHGRVRTVRSGDASAAALHPCPDPQDRSSRTKAAGTRVLFSIARRSVVAARSASRDSARCAESLGRGHADSLGAPSMRSARKPARFHPPVPEGKGTSRQPTRN